MSKIEGVESNGRPLCFKRVNIVGDSDGVAVFEGLESARRYMVPGCLHRKYPDGLKLVELAGVVGTGQDLVDGVYEDR